jgi:hypothetical protein
VARGDVGYFGETGLGAEVFGDQSEVPDRYGASFAPEQDRILCTVDPKDLPPEIEGEMLLVERDVRLRLVPASELAAQAQAKRPRKRLRKRQRARNPWLWRKCVPTRMRALSYATYVVATPGPTALLVFKMVRTQIRWPSASAWQRLPNLTGRASVMWAMSYISEATASPFDQPGSRGLLEAILRTARSCDPLETSSPEAIQHALAARLQHPGWQLIARAISSPESVTA